VPPPNRTRTARNAITDATACGNRSWCRLSGAAFRDPIGGSRTRDTGASKVNSIPCGTAICGLIYSLEDTSGKAKVGQHGFPGLKQTAPGNHTAKAVAPADGKQKFGSITIHGDPPSGGDSMLGGPICKKIA
jgi:hypothetical protein